jgi:outer membrane protein
MQTLRSIVVGLALSTMVVVSAQEPQAQEQIWGLEQCIEHALNHNLTIKRQQLNADLSRNQYQQKKLDLLPNLNANGSYRTQSGRVRDENEFRLIDVTNRDGSLGVSSNTPVFEGFARRNAIKKGNTDWQAVLKDVEKAENDMALRITSLYMQILFDKELLEAARQQFETVQMQVDRTEKLVQAGTSPEGTLLEVRSLAARDALSVTQLENNLTLSLLDLAQALDLESAEGFDIVTPQIPELSGAELVQTTGIFDYAVNNLPQIAASEYRLESSEMDVNIAKGALMPRLSFNLGWNTYVSKFDGQPNFDFGQSFKDNASQYYGLSLSVPIFNSLSARTGVKNANIGVLNAQYALEQEKQVLRKEIQQAHADAQAAFRQYEAGRSAVDSYQESFRYTEKRYNVGMVNSVDYNVAKTEFMKAESDFIQAKYTYLLRLKILDFYQGKAIVL